MITKSIEEELRSVFISVSETEDDGKMEKSELESDVSNSNRNCTISSDNSIQQIQGNCNKNLRNYNNQQEKFSIPHLIYKKEKDDAPKGKVIGNEKVKV